jgi:hypothetical protein
LISHLSYETITNTFISPRRAHDPKPSLLIHSVCSLRIHHLQCRYPFWMRDLFLGNRPSSSFTVNIANQLSTQKTNYHYQSLRLPIFSLDCGVCVCLNNHDVTRPFLTNVAGPRITAQTHPCHTPCPLGRNRKTCLFSKSKTAQKQRTSDAKQPTHPRALTGTRGRARIVGAGTGHHPWRRNH